MKLIINGEPLEQPVANLAVLLELVEAPSHSAVAVNETFVPKTLYRETSLHEGDRIEILSPMQGG